MPRTTPDPLDWRVCTDADTQQQYVHILYSWQHSKLSTSLFSYWNFYFDCCFLNWMTKKIHAAPLDHPFPHWGSVPRSIWTRRSARKKLSKARHIAPHIPTTSPPPFFHWSLQKSHWSPLTATRDLARVTLLFLVFDSITCNLILFPAASILIYLQDPIQFMDI
jgi:hypothetical protein